MRVGLVSLWMMACKDEPADEVPVVDLVSALGPGEVRAGVVTDPAALIGGISSEGRVGDVKLYNDRARFIVQGARMSSFYLTQGGGVVDADVVRPDGEPGHDVVDEWMTLVSLTRVLEPTELVVENDGSDGQPARVVVRGIEGALTVLEGLTERPGSLPALGLEIEQTYVLAPDSPLLEVTTTVTTTQETVLYIGDVLAGAPETAAGWWQTGGFAGEEGLSRQWAGYVGHGRDVAVAILAAPDGALVSGAGAVLSELTDMVVGFGPTVTVPAGETLTHVRYWGVGPDLATLTDAWHGVAQDEVVEVAGTVEADDGPVAGAWVQVLVDDAPYTMAVSGADGTFSAAVPAGASSRAVAVGEGTGRFLDLPAGAAPYGPYAAEAQRQASLASYAGGMAAIPSAVGRGVGSEAEPLRLGDPGTLRLMAEDGAPFTAWIDGGDGGFDARLALGRPSGHAAVGFARSGSVDLVVPAGSYTLLAHRGLRYELDQGPVEVAAGQVTERTVRLVKAYDHPGWLLGDPHAHASPSGDAAISMEDRLIVHASAGVQVHFGTDHDQVANYAPLLQALGLGGVLRTVVADEVSPPLRGHFNVYPVAQVDEANGGAWSWWTDIPASTEDMVDRLRARHGDGFILQSNHPTDSGMAAAAGWSPGNVANPNKWTKRIEALEVLNSGSYDEFLPLYHDLVAHGQVVTPVGVSDSHAHLAGHTGISTTFLQVGVDEPSDLTDAALVAAMRAQRTIVSHGLFLELSVPPGEVVAPGTSVTVTTRSASWIVPTRLRLLRDGVEIGVVEGTTAEFVLEAASDAAFVVIAEGDQAMAPVDGDRPWAMAAAWLVDVGGDGWVAPMGALVP